MTFTIFSSGVRSFRSSSPVVAILRLSLLSHSSTKCSTSDPAPLGTNVANAAE